jgi:hypothetical protein
MEGEDGHPLNYGGAEVIVFRRDAPLEAVRVAGGVAGRVVANSTFTSDGRLILLEQDPPEPSIPEPDDPRLIRIKRVTFTPGSFDSTPEVASVETVPVPDALKAPVDPDQFGPSTAEGFITFTATYEHAPSAPTPFMRPLWRMPANGVTNEAYQADPSVIALVGCPICETGCCGFATPELVLGTNDSRISHAGTEVVWMHEHPDVSTTLDFPELPEPIVIHPYRQHKSDFVSPQVALAFSTDDPVHATAYANWRGDDGELVYWDIRRAPELPLDTFPPVMRQRLMLMDPAGETRVEVPLPASFCVSHASYVSNSRVIFTAWQQGPTGSCAASAL